MKFYERFLVKLLMVIWITNKCVYGGFLEFRRMNTKRNDSSFFDHLPYSSELTLSDIHLFTKLKNLLGSDEELKEG